MLLTRMMILNTKTMWMSNTQESQKITFTNSNSYNINHSVSFTWTWIVSVEKSNHCINLCFSTTTHALLINSKLHLFARLMQSLPRYSAQLMNGLNVADIIVCRSMTFILSNSGKYSDELPFAMHSLKPKKGA